MTPLIPSNPTNQSPTNPTPAESLPNGEPTAPPHLAGLLRVDGKVLDTSGSLTACLPKRPTNSSWRHCCSVCLSPTGSSDSVSSDGHGAKSPTASTTPPKAKSPFPTNRAANGPRRSRYEPATCLLDGGDVVAVCDRCCRHHRTTVGMTAALTFSPGQALMIAIIALAFLLVIVWGVFEGEAERVQRAKDRQLRREIRRQP